ncbi:hypothetical protein VNO77_27044 [Canavalia gladiata]|uniref:Uncharacterized protein n=1 Tax=Canavalia gladiata TaxID=3824 RepID=A0AAN9Q648_CANGL
MVWTGGRTTVHVTLGLVFKSCPGPFPFNSCTSTTFMDQASLCQLLIKWTMLPIINNIHGLGLVVPTSPQVDYVTHHALAHDLTFTPCQMDRSKSSPQHFKWASSY